MTFNDANAEFSTKWEIDQILSTGTASVSAGNNFLYTIPDSSFPPIFEVVGNPGDGSWYRPGQNGLITGVGLKMNAYISGSNLRVITDRAATIRYYVWSDKITY